MKRGGGGPYWIRPKCSKPCRLSLSVPIFELPGVMEWYDNRNYPAENPLLDPIIGSSKREIEGTCTRLPFSFSFCSFIRFHATKRFKTDQKNKMQETESGREGDNCIRLGHDTVFGIQYSLLEYSIPSLSLVTHLRSLAAVHYLTGYIEDDMKPHRDIYNH